MNSKKQTFIASAIINGLSKQYGRTKIFIGGRLNLMQKLLLPIFFTSLCAFPALAQSSDDYNKVEFYGGYSYNREQSPIGSSTGFGATFTQCSSEATPIIGKNFQTSFCHRRGFNGFDTSITYNFNRYFGVKANVTGYYKTEAFTDTFDGVAETTKPAERIYNFLVGVQLKNNGKDARFKPFAHALVGAVRYSRADVNTSPIPADNFTNRGKVTSFAMKLGGGIDLRVNRRIDFRLVEVDYNPIFTRGFDVAGSPFGVIHGHGRTANNFTIGFGIVIH